MDSNIERNLCTHCSRMCEACVCCGNEQYCVQCGTCNICSPGEIKEYREKRNARHREASARRGKPGS